MEYDELLKKLNSAQRENENLKSELQEVMSLQLRMETELTSARDIQIRMVPRVFPAFPDKPDMDIYAKLIPAREVGGDFYDYYFLDDQHLLLTMGDVFGKGVAAALLMAICKSMLKSIGQITTSPSKIVNHINEIMANDNHNYMFVSLFVGVLNIDTGKMVYTNAGHNPTYIKRKDGSLIKLKDIHGPVAAAMSGMNYKESVVHVDAGDLIFAYTDGITEAHNQKGELFTEQRLEAVILNEEFITAKQLVEAVFTETLLFERGREQFDDITAWCLRYKVEA